MQPFKALSPLAVIDIISITRDAQTYSNIPLSLVNDHVIRVSIMTEPFYWHLHPNSDETFLTIEGVVCIDLEDKTVELSPGQIFTIPANVKHRTRPLGSRSVNITFERADMQTTKLH